MAETKAPKPPLNVKTSMGKPPIKKGKSMIPPDYLASPHLDMWLNRWKEERKSIRDIRKGIPIWDGKEGIT